MQKVKDLLILIDTFISKVQGRYQCMPGKFENAAVFYLYQEKRELITKVAQDSILKSTICS